MICVVPRIAPRAKRRGCGRRPPARQLRHSLSQAYRCIHTRIYIYIYICIYIVGNFTRQDFVRFRRSFRADLSPQISAILVVFYVYFIWEMAVSAILIKTSTTIAQTDVKLLARELPYQARAFSYLGCSHLRLRGLDVGQRQPNVALETARNHLLLLLLLLLLMIRIIVILVYNHVIVYSYNYNNTTNHNMTIVMMML